MAEFDDWQTFAFKKIISCLAQRPNSRGAAILRLIFHTINFFSILHDEVATLGIVCCLNNEKYLLIKCA